MSSKNPLDELFLQPFQERTVRHVYDRMIDGGQGRFLVADEVGLGKTKVAQGLIALMTDNRRGANVLYLASSGHIVGQNLDKLKTNRLAPGGIGSLCLLAETAHNVRGQLIGLTPIKDLRSDHFGSIRERALIYKLLTRKHRSLTADPSVREFFKGSRATAETFNHLVQGTVPSALRDQFEARLDPAVITQLSNPEQRSRHRRAIVGALRGLLASCALNQLNPALVVVDEIQRFSDRLLTEQPTPQVEYLLKRPLLVLSATPYQPGAAGDHSGPDPHRGFIQLIDFLNHEHPARTTDVTKALTEMRSALLVADIHSARLQAAVDDLGNHLRECMVRTERPFDAHVERIPVVATLDSLDLKALRQSMELLKRAPLFGKNKTHRFAELIELWKSTPHVASALGDRYVTGQALGRVVGKRVPTPAGLTSAQLRREKPMGSPTHPRLRALMKALGADGQEHRLWLPPSLPYIHKPSRVTADPPSKTLIFTSWGAAPPAISTALNLLVEPKPSRPKDLEFARKSKRSGVSEPVRSVYILGAPLWRFGDESDPFSAVRRAGGAVSGTRMITDIRKQLADAGVVKVARTATSQSEIDIAIALNAVAWGGPPKPEQSSYLKPAQDLMSSVEAIQTAVVTRAQADFLAELAAAAPGTCAYRALRRTIPGVAEESLLYASMSIGHSITRLFQRPAAAAIVEAGRWNTQAPYWRRVLRYCLEHDLQSTLDEYMFLLVGDSSEKEPGQLASDVAEAIDVALSTVGGLSVARPKAKVGSSYGAAMYARALGEHDSQSEANYQATQKPMRAKRKRSRQANPLLTAFNSPFPPFVLTTTSTGQEGLDMHRYCRRLVHWNLPRSPLALEQREGRVDRYLSLGVRSNIAKIGIPKAQQNDSGADATNDDRPPENPWGLLVEAAQRLTDEHSSLLSPLWHFGEGQPIKAHAINIPFSREETEWERLLEEASWYRLVLGQPDPNTLLERLSNASEKNRRAISGIRLDLGPQ